MKLTVLSLVLGIAFCAAAQSANIPARVAKNHAAPVARALTEQDLPITIAGFLQGGNEQEKIDGVCGTDETRNVLNCDIHNGLSGWTITESTLGLLYWPYKDDDVRYYRISKAIAPLTTEHISIRLGLQLPPDEMPVGRKTQGIRHWRWLIVRAKGRPAK